MSVITAGGKTGTKPAELPRRNGTKPAELPRRNGTQRTRRAGESSRSRVSNGGTAHTSGHTPARNGTRPAPVVRRGSHAARMPFVLLIVGLLTAGLVTLLLLNTATASGSFTESELSDRNAALTLQQQELERTVGALNTPDGLAAAAAKLGMVPGGDPVFLLIKPDGSSKIIGTPAPATAPPAPQPPPPTNPPASPQNQQTQNQQSQNQTQHQQAQNQSQNQTGHQNQAQHQTHNENQNQAHNDNQNQNQQQTNHAPANSAHHAEDAR